MSRRAAALVLALLAGCTSSVDLERGRPYACEPDGGDAASLCGEGWRCGIEGRCHAIGDAKAWPCRAAADCEGSWVCGLEGTCHDPAVASDYLCTGDEHCTAPWRCGYAGRCLDATLELRSLAPSTPLEVTLLGPRLDFSSGEVSAAANLADEVAAIATGSTVRFLRKEGPTTRVFTFDAGVPPGSLAVDRAGAYLFTPAGVERLLLDGRRDVAFEADGGAWLGAQHRDWGPFVVENGVVRFVGASGRPLTLAPAEPTAAVVASCAYFLDGAGLWVQPVDDVMTQPAPLTVSAWFQGSCGLRPQGYSVMRGLLRVGGTTRTILGLAAHREARASIPLDGGIGTFLPPRNVVSAIDVTRLSEPANGADPAGTGVCVLPPPTARTQCPASRKVELLTCPSPCESGDEVTDLRPGETTLEVECTGVFGQSTWSMPYGAACAAELLGGTSSRWGVLRSPGELTTSLDQLVQTGPRGQLWVGEQVSSATAWFLDEAPVAALRPGTTDDAGIAPPQFVTLSQTAQLEPELGLVTRPAPAVLGYAAGGLDFALNRSGAVVRVGQADGGELVPMGRVAVLDVAPEQLRPPVTLSLAARDDAGVLLVTVGDGLYAAEQRDWARRVPLRLVPQPGFGITSLALAAGPGVQGYLSTRSAVFAFASTSAASWSISAVRLPVGVVVEAWTDDGASRVGFSDGRVLSLPSGVPLAAAVDGEEFVDFLGLCGQVYGLTDRGLRRLTQSGAWENVDLPGAEVVFDETLGRGRLLSLEGRVLVFNGAGGGASFRPTPTCGD